MLGDAFDFGFLIDICVSLIFYKLSGQIIVILLTIEKPEARQSNVTMWWVEKLESANKLILFQNDRPVRDETDVLIFIVDVSPVQEDETGRKIKVSFANGSSLLLSLDDFSPRDSSLRADLKALDFAKQFAEQFAEQLPEKPKSGYTTRHIVAGLIGGACAVAAAPVVLTGVGFTAGGIAAGSYAASMMSAAAVANGGAIAAGSTVAVLQSVGAAGLGTAGVAVVGGAGATVGATASGVAGAFQNYFRGRAGPKNKTETETETEIWLDTPPTLDTDDESDGEGMGYNWDWDEDDN